MSEEIKKPAVKLGRPSLYTPELQALATDYIDNWDLYLKHEQPDGTFTRSINSIPSVAGLALSIGVHRATIYDWAKVHPIFLDTLEDIKTKQEVFLMHHGLTKGYDSGFAKFMAINVTKYRDKIETVHAVSDDVKKLVIDMGE